MVLVIFWRFLNFGPFLGTVGENVKHKRVAPGISLNLKNPNIDIWVPKMRFDKMYIFGAPIEYGIFLIREKPALRAALIIKDQFC